VQGLKAKGKTVVLISHRPGIVGVADRLLILHQGAVQASGPRDGVLAALQKQREAAQAALAPTAPAPPSTSANDEGAAGGNPSSNS
jgi:ATP-binding cassette subfamily C exporter for protease/lipase